MAVRGWQLRPTDPEYPRCLKDSPRPPEVLYGIGDPAALRLGLGVVGSRKATPYGLACARRFTGWAARSGITVVSGGAIGCDQEAHRAALEAAGTTVAVLGCGADVDYPRGAGALLDEIRRRGACVSELPWGREPTRWAFVERNRLIAALSAALLVVEAGLPSGTFSTADFALEAGREVLAVPGSIFAPGCRGSNRLIRQGATPVTDVSELAAAVADAGLAIAAPSGTAGAERSSPGASRSLQPPDEVSSRVLAALLADPMKPDDAARALDLDIVTLIRILGALEASGAVARYRDGRYGPC
ncbi:MAG: DNA-protecting protein DprA [Coriobacteriia bacterium]|nr:DNA-protecting protein DprA [Coriobacteriia bacterium]